MKKEIIWAFAGTVLGLVGGARAALKTEVKEKIALKELSDKHLALYMMMNQWVRVKQEGKNIADYLKQHNFTTIAVYGMSYVGERLIEELKGSEVEVAYGIDKNAGGIYADIEAVTPDETLKEVNAVIVTSIFFMDEIERDLSAKLSCPILSLEDILYEL